MKPVDLALFFVKIEIKGGFLEKFIVIASK